ncbi:MAG: hypothetical protein NTZ10_00440 [Candidatus Saganbacteria bacterium]|nr:hypothetical protein [Candidatus Saganbacteria bacterium]
MNPKTMIKEIINGVKTLPERQMRSVVDFITYIREKETEENILNSKTIINAVKRSKKAWDNGKTADFTSWEQIKKKNNI